MSDFLRSRNGKVIHKKGCPRAGRAVVWGWADDMTEQELRVRILAYPWLSECRTCWPEPLAVELMRQKP